MFDSEFFPTPNDVIETMGIDCFDKVVLEPSAGSGNIVRWLNANGAKEVLACEKNLHLRAMLRDCALLGSDFFAVTAEDVSHVQLIVMNPPFSNGAEHILHAWKVAPEGCEIISLCNWETVNKDYWGLNKQLAAVIADYGEAQYLGDCFRKAERQTDVEVGLVRLFKPVVSEATDFEGFYLDMDAHPGDTGVMRYDEIRAVVQNYVGAVRAFDKVAAAGEELARYTTTQFGSNRFSFGHGVAFQAVWGDKAGITTKKDFARQMQMASWRFIFNQVGIEKYVTTGVLKDVNRFIDSRKNYPFTVRNVYRMLEIIVGTREHTMNRAIVEAVDYFTRSTHDNRYGVEGWKTNEGHLLNRKFITGWIAENNWGNGLHIRSYHSVFEQIKDLVKALCYVTGKNIDTIPDVNTCGEEGKQVFYPNTWYDWGFFRFKVFKKGTGHFEFKSEDDWAMLNRAYAKAKGQALPETTFRKKSRAKKAA